MDAIVSVTADWGIGCEGRLLVPNRKDMARFRRLTEGGIVIAGRKTVESFPDGVLPNRLNIMISSKKVPQTEGLFQAGNIGEAVDIANELSEGTKRIWVIGGSSIYRQMLPMCERAYVTKHDVLMPADSFFPDLDATAEWRVTDRSPEEVTEGGVCFEFVTYANSRFVP